MRSCPNGRRKCLWIKDGEWKIDVGVTRSYESMSYLAARKIMIQLKVQGSESNKMLS